MAARADTGVPLRTEPLRTCDPFVVTGVVDCVGERVEFRVGVVLFVVSDDVLRPVLKAAAGGFLVAADIVAEQERSTGRMVEW